eukprot:5335977-Pyramimonas_sp.AAC.1
MYTHADTYTYAYTDTYAYTYTYTYTSTYTYTYICALAGRAGAQITVGPVSGGSSEGGATSGEEALLRACARGLQRPGRRP